MGASLTVSTITINFLKKEKKRETTATPTSPVSPWLSTQEVDECSAMKEEQTSRVPSESGSQQKSTLSAGSWAEKNHSIPLQFSNTKQTKNQNKQPEGVPMLPQTTMALVGHVRMCLGGWKRTISYV